MRRINNDNVWAYVCVCVCDLQSVNNCFTIPLRFKAKEMGAVDDAQFEDLLERSVQAASVHANNAFEHSQQLHFSLKCRF